MKSSLEAEQDEVLQPEEEKKGHVIKKSWSKKPKYVKPVHQIDPNDPDLDAEEIFNEGK